MSREERTIHDEILTKYDKHDQMNVENIQERNCLEIKNVNVKNQTGFWCFLLLGGGIVVYMGKIFGYGGG